MKLTSLMVTLVSARVSLNSKFAMRKYSQLMSVFKHHDHAFDEQKYWHYGCNCQILNHSAMSSPGYGASLDPLDKTCKDYRECLQCASEQFGETCAAEIRKYNFKSVMGAVTCTDPANTCERALCECTSRFAHSHTQHKHHYNQQE